MAYFNSGIAQRINVVARVHVDYDETTDDMATDLIRLTNTSDGFMDNVAALRDSYDADCVVLIVQDGNACGIGYQMSSVSSSFSSYAYSVVKRSCATDNWSFAHELGHNNGRPP